MKYMNQRVFDCFCLRIILEMVTNRSGAEFTKMVEEYDVIYKGDYLYFSQGIEAANILVESWANLSSNDKFHLVESIRGVRELLDDDMKEKKSMISKIFSGPAFISSHPNPNERVKQTIKNINLIIKLL